MGLRGGFLRSKAASTAQVVTSLRLAEATSIVHNNILTDSIEVILVGTVAQILVMS